MRFLTILFGAAMIAFAIAFIWLFNRVTTPTIH